MIKAKQDIKLKTIENDQKDLFNYLKEVPENCKSLVNEGDLVYVVPGDGACGANSAAAHLFQDEVYGPRLRKKMNIFFAKHFFDKYQFKTSCSPDSPFRRQIKNEIVEFTDPKQLIEFLKTSEEASYMWIDSEDLATIADMFQIRIKVVTTKGAKDENPTVNWILPDETLAEEAEIKNVDIEDMVLLHENDIHFNLVVSKNSVLATMGSLSYRNNIAPLVEKKKRVEIEAENKEIEEPKVSEMENKSLEIQIEKMKVENTYLKEKLKQQEENNCVTCERAEKDEPIYNKHTTVEHDEKKIICDECSLELKTMLQLDAHKKSVHVTAQNKISCDKDCKEKQDHMEKEYLKCEIELRKITEENEKNKIKIKDLRKIKELRQEVKKLEDENNKDDELLLVEMKNKGYKRSVPQSESVPRRNTKNEGNNQMNIKCKKCSYISSGESHLKNHMKLIHSSNDEEEEFNCMKCDYQGNSKFQLQKHTNIKHTNDDKTTLTIGQIKCRLCGEDFEERVNLMIHRKVKHKTFVAQCKNYLEKNCTFTSESCWWIHETKDTRSEGIPCYVCNRTFNTKAKMMIHRKKYHSNIVKPCQKFLEGKCPFQEEFCWFNHNQSKKVSTNAENDKIEDTFIIENEEASDFQQEIKKMKPPLNKMKTNKEN